MSDLRMALVTSILTSTLLQRLRHTCCC